MRTIAVDRRRDLTAEAFFKEYYLTDTPVVLEAAAATWWPAAVKWDLKTLRTLVGERSVEVRKNTSSINYKLGKWYLVSTMPFRQYADWHLNSSPERYDHYLAVNNIKLALPELAPDVPLPPHVGKLHAGPYLWIAHERHYEYTHTDAHDNFCCVLRGRKRFKIFGTRDFDKLYPHEWGLKGKTLKSQVDLDDIDQDRFPKIKDALCMEADIREGDIIFVPSLFWHQVSTLEPATISVNIFFGTKGESDYIDKMLKPPRSDAFRYWVLHIIAQNQKYPCFSKIMEEKDLPRSLRNLFFKIWHERMRDDQVQKIIEWINQYFMECGDTYTIDLKLESGSTRKRPRRLKIRGMNSI